MPLPHVVDIFNKRYKEGLRVISECGLPFEEVGIFGSYARGDYGPNSDIDFCLVFKNSTVVPDITLVYPIRDKLDLLGCDLIGTTRERLDNEDTSFYRNLRKDYRRCEIGEKSQ